MNNIYLTSFQYVEKTSLEFAADFLLQSACYLLGGRTVEVIKCAKIERYILEVSPPIHGQNSEGSTTFRQIDNSYEKNYLKTMIHVICLLPCSIIGGILKFAAMKLSSKFKKIHAKYENAEMNEEVINTLQTQKKVVVLSPGSIDGQRLENYFKKRYIKETEFTVINARAGCPTPLSSDIPDEDFDLYIVNQPGIIDFFGSEGGLSDDMYDSFVKAPNVRQITFVSLKSNSKKSLEGILNNQPHLNKIRPDCMLESGFLLKQI